MTAGTYQEDELLQQVAGGDEGAFRLLFDGHRDRVYAQALGILKDTHSAEDVVQEVFLKIWTHRGQLTGIQSLPAYLNTLTRNHIISGFRKLATEENFLRQLIREGEVRVDKSRSDAVVYRELARILDEAVRNLPQRQRQVYTLGRIEGCSYGEIARELKIAPDTVKSHMKEALRTVRKRLKQYQGLIVLLLLGLHGY